MAIIIKNVFFSVCLLFSISAMAHTIYAPNDIPLLDNRVRIDPKTEQVTFIFNHSKGYQRVVLVQPDGSKLYQQRHPKDTVAWVSSKTQDIVTVLNPMVGPWQAIATLDGDNRIKLISEVKLEVNKLPLKLYAQEYITTHASLYADGKLMQNASYLDGAKLSVSLLGGANKQMALYQDNGKHYDQLPFDGELTARLYVDLQPGRYLLSIRTKNDIFIRNVNKDAVIFLAPVSYEIEPLEVGSDQAKMTFNLDIDEIDPKSVSINGVIKDVDNKVVAQVMLHNFENISETGQFSAIQQLEHGGYEFSGKAYATTHQGRDIELQLTKRIFELLPTYYAPKAEVSEAVSTIANDEEQLLAEIETPQPDSIFSNIWVIIALSLTVLLLIAGIVFFIIKRKSQSIEETGDELILDELQPMPIDIKKGK